MPQAVRDFRKFRALFRGAVAVVDGQTPVHAVSGDAGDGERLPAALLRQHLFQRRAVLRGKAQAREGGPVAEEAAVRVDIEAFLGRETLRAGVVQRGKLPGGGLVVDARQGKFCIFRPALQRCPRAVRGCAERRS